MISTGMLANTLYNRFRNGYNNESETKFLPYSKQKSIFSNYSLSNLYSYHKELYETNIFRRSVLPIKERFSDIKNGFSESSLTNDLIKTSINNIANNTPSTNNFIYNETKGFLSHIYKGNFVNTFG